jgi:hypothetical protein
MPANSPSGRAIENEAKRILEHEGYQVVRAGYPAPFDLIAWKDSADILCLIIRSGKSVKIGGFPESIRELSALLREGKAPGKCQFWIKKFSQWKRFQILPGGTIKLKEENHVNDQVCT